MSNDEIRNPKNNQCKKKKKQKKKLEMQVYQSEV